MEKWKRIILLIGVFILVISSVTALTGNKTEFDDGSSNFNITSNTTKYVTLPINSSIISANITLFGLKRELVTDKEIGYNCTGDSISNCASAFDEDWSTGLIINAGSTNNIFLENYSLVSGSSYANYIYYGYALSVLCAGTCSYTYLKANCYNGSNFITFGTSVFTSSQNNISSTIPSACLINPVQIKLNHSVSINTNPILYESAIEWGNSTYYEHKCYQESANVSSTCGGLNTGTYSSSFDANNDQYLMIDGSWNTLGNVLPIGTNFSINYTKPIGATEYSVWQTKGLIYPSTYMLENLSLNRDINDNVINCWDAYSDKISLKFYVDTNDNLTFSCSNTTNWITLQSYNSTDSAMFEEEGMWWSLRGYPQNVTLYINNTNVTNIAGNLTQDNTIIDLNINNILNTCYINNNICPFKFISDFWGEMQITNLFIQYNLTNSANLIITSPVQISKSITTGTSFTQAVNISNSGNWNATNLTFITVSSSTPNLNDSITHDCGSLTFGNNTHLVCNVTFSNILIAPESDEKLRLRAIGTDNNDLVFSSSIDVDITLNPVVATTGGGGGGGRPTACEWKVWRPANRVIKSFGWFGYKTNPISYQIFNNESQAIEFNYRTTGLNCELTQNKQVIEGNSFGLNQIQCEYPESVDTGIIIIDGGGCSQSIDVQLVSNTFGLLTTYITGGAGVLVALVIWFSIFMVIIFITKVI